MPGAYRYPEATCPAHNRGIDVSTLFKHETERYFCCICTWCGHKGEKRRNARNAESAWQKHLATLKQQSEQQR